MQTNRPLPSRQRKSHLLAELALERFLAAVHTRMSSDVACLPRGGRGARGFTINTKREMIDVVLGSAARRARTRLLVYWQLGHLCTLPPLADFLLGASAAKCIPKHTHTGSGDSGELNFWNAVKVLRSIT